MASSLNPAAARSYASLHATTSAFFLRDIVDRINLCPNSANSVVALSHSTLLAASIHDAIGRFIMRMTYGHVVVENDPLLQMVRRQADYIMTGFAKHYWVNDLPIRKPSCDSMMSSVRTITVTSSIHSFVAPRRWI